MDKEEKLGFLDPRAITAFVAAFMGDCTFVFLILGVLIPIVGFAFLAIILGMHYLAGLITGALAIPKLNGLIPKLVVFAGIILPLPTLLIGLLAGMLLQNKLLQTAAIIAVGAVTGGTGAVALRGASMAAEAAEEGAAAEEVGAAKAGTSAGKGGFAKKPGAAGAETKEEVSPEALGEEPEPLEKLRRELLEETPSEGNKKEDGDEEEENVRIDDENNEVDLRGAGEYKAPSWLNDKNRLYDKKAEAAGKLMNERYEIAKTLGVDKNRAAKKILDLGKEEAGQKSK